MVKRVLEFRYQLWTRVVSYAEQLWPGGGLRYVPHLICKVLRKYVRRNGNSGNNGD
jgi:hypothetical protein